MLAGKPPTEREDCGAQKRSVNRPEAGKLARKVRRSADYCEPTIAPVATATA